MSPTNPDGLCDRQFIAIASEKQAGVFALPSQNCVYRKKLVDFDFIVKAEIISMKGEDTRNGGRCELDAKSHPPFSTIPDSVCLICYASNGHLMVFTLPSLKPLLEVDFLPLADLRYVGKIENGGVGVIQPGHIPSISWLSTSFFPSLPRNLTNTTNHPNSDCTPNGSESAATAKQFRLGRY